MKTISRYIMTLALLLTAVTGAWADGIVCTASDLGKVLCTDGSIYENVSAATTAGKTAVAVIAYVDETNKNGLAIALADEGGKMDWSTAKSTCEGKTAITGAKWCLPSTDDWIAMFKANGGNEGSYTGLNNALAAAGGNDSKLQDADYWTSTLFEGFPWNVSLKDGSVWWGIEAMSTGYLVRACLAFDPNAIDVTPVAGKTNEWTFTMPAYDVEIAPIYAPTAQWAKVENDDQLPTAAEGIYAESTDSIITPGKVAKIGETEDLQGEVMYFATGDKNMTAEKAAKANGWLSKLPTAAGYERDTTIYVWYYIKGADAPEGDKATAENTFNDSEICAEPIEVKILSNKFDIQFKAANDNTIEAEKATVTVGGTAATVTEGKLTGVKMGSEVKVKAKDGYKFRKVEAKKGGLLSITIGGSTTATIYYVEGETWAQAMENHPEENAAWKIDQDGDITGNGNYLSAAGDDFVNSNSIINPNAGYTFGWT